MTKSTITRERVVALIAEHSYDSALVDALEHLLAAMDSEPVAWTDEEELRDVNDAGIGYLFGIDREANKFADPRRQIMLYRHAQQPVVPDGLVKAVEFYEQVKRENPPVETGAWKDAVDWVLKEACRAAMLNGGKP